MFDPAPTGVEKHKPGHYSDYEIRCKMFGAEQYEMQRWKIVRFDEMVDRLSLAKIEGELCNLHATPIWELYLRGREAQSAIEKELVKAFATEGEELEQVLIPWMQSVID